MQSVGTQRGKIGISTDAARGKLTVLTDGKKMQSVGTQRGKIGISTHS